MSTRLTLSSPQLQEGARFATEQAFDRHGCPGANLSPALAWHDAPKQTRSFAITLHDLDVPHGGGWWHWIIINIPAEATGLARGAGDPEQPIAPAGTLQLHNDFGTPGYGGPCPPPGDRPHRYQFTLYALKCATLPLEGNATKGSALAALHEQTLQTAVLHGSYSR